jgi:NAD(P)H dehydrogenase (quinone)
MKINVMGATGQLGRKVIQKLLDQGARAQDLIASVRSLEKAKDLADRGVVIRHADYDDPASLLVAYQESDVLLLIPSLASIEPRIMQHNNALEAAKEAGVKRVAFTSFTAAKPDSKFFVATFMLYAESKLRLSGMDWTILRDGMYLDPIADWIPDLVKAGRLPYPVEKGRVAYISRYDLARGIAAACLNSGHSEKIYELTGPKALSMDELAEAISNATGKIVEFHQVTEKEYAEICRADNIPEPMIAILASMYRAVDNGEFETVSDHVELLTGTPPESAESYLTRVVQTF